MVVVMRMEAVVVTINGMVVVLIVQLLQLFVQTIAQVMVYVIKRLESVIVIVNGKVAMIVL